MAPVSFSKGRKLNGPVGTTAVIGIAIIAQSYLLGQEYILDGLLLYAISIALGFRFLPRLPLVDSLKGQDRACTKGVSLTISRAGLWVGGTALVSNLIALFFFGTSSNLNLAWTLYAASVVLAPFSIWLLSGKPSVRPMSGWQLEDTLALCVVLAVGAAFRLHQIDSIPFGLWWDEAVSGNQALRIINDPSFRPVYVAESVHMPALLWYMMVPLIWLFGPTSVGIRLSAVAGGLLGIVAVTLLARELFGRRAGFVAGTIVAVMTWHVNFSRYAHSAIWSVAFDTLAVYFLVLGMRTGRLTCYGLAGTALGLGLNMYHSSRFLPVLLAIYLAYRLIAGKRAFITANLWGLIVFSLVTLVTISPLAQFAIQKPGEFNSRFDQITIVRDIEKAQSLQPLVENIRKHLLMFHYQGDNNGRHNLPRAPMLDQVTAAMLLLGIVMAFKQAGDHRFFLLLSWFLVMLTGGVITLPFEAPQGFRTIEVITPVAILSTLPILAIWQQLRKLNWGEFRLLFPAGSVASPQAAVPLTCLAICALLVAIGVLNYQRYFSLQATDFGSWSAFSTAETEVGRQIKSLGPRYEVLLGQTYSRHPTIEFLTGRDNYPVFDPATHLALSGIRNAAIFLEYFQSQAFDQLRQHYPQGDFRTLRTPNDGSPFMFSAVIDQEQILRLQGLTGSYYTNREWAGEPVLVEQGVGMRFEMEGSRLPDPPFSTTWQGTLSAPEYGRYGFKLEGPAAVELFIDENRVLAGGQEESIVLAKGLHAFKIRAVVEETSPIAVYWKPPNAAQMIPIPREAVFSPPVTNNGLLGSYYGNKNWSGAPALQRIDPFLNMRVHLLPLERPYSVEWIGKIDIPISGVYLFATESADISWLYIDDQLVATNEGANRQLREGSIHLEEGLHDIRVRYYDESTHTFIRAYWTPPGGKRELIPRERLYPPQANYRSVARSLAAPATVDSGVPATAVSPGMVRLEFLANITGPSGSLVQPREVAASPDGKLYVVDSAAKRVSIYTQDGALVGRLQADFVEPFAVVVARGGQVLVLDSKGREPIMLFTPDGRLLSQMGGNLGTYSPRGLSIDASDNLYLADTGRSRVLKLTTAGQLLGEFRGSGQLAQPVAVAAAGDGTMYVVDAEKHQLWVLDTKDQVVRNWAIIPSTTVNAPHVALGPRGELYVSDPRGGVVRVFDQQGRTLAEVGAPGAGNGQFNLPTGIRVDTQGQLWVADTGNRRVQRWIIR